MILPQQSCEPMFTILSSTESHNEKPTRQWNSINNAAAFAPKETQQSPIYRRSRSLPGQLCSEESGRPLFWFLPVSGDTANRRKTKVFLQPRMLVNEQTERSSNPLPVNQLTSQLIQDLTFPDLSETTSSESFDGVIQECTNDEDDDWSAYSSDSVESDTSSVSSELIGLEFATLFDSSHDLVGLEFLVDGDE